MSIDDLDDDDCETRGKRGNGDVHHMTKNKSTSTGTKIIGGATGAAAIGAGIYAAYVYLNPLSALIMGIATLVAGGGLGYYYGRTPSIPKQQEADRSRSNSLTDDQKAKFNTIYEVVSEAQSNAQQLDHETPSLPKKQERPRSNSLTDEEIRQYNGIIDANIGEAQSNTGTLNPDMTDEPDKLIAQLQSVQPVAISPNVQNK
jgi:hypothetical protein